MRPILGLPIVLGAALIAFGCQNDSNATFDDSDLPSQGAAPNGGKGGSNSGGSSADAGSSAQGGDAANGGDTANGGSGGKAMGGAGGKAMGGTGGKAMGGTGGMPQGGNMMGGGAGMSGGNPQGGMAGMGGMNNPPEPVTIKITEIVDAYVASCMTNTNYGSEKILDVDGDFNCVIASLLQPTLTAIPAGATVTQATLTLYCIDRGDELSIYYANAKWTESMVRWNNRPTVGAPIGTLACTQDGSTVTLDLTDAVVAWLSGGQEQNGIYLTTKNTNGVTFDSTEADTLANRPSLSVTYTPAAK